MTDFNNTPKICAAHSRYLSDLVSINSVYTNPQGIENALRYCESDIVARLARFRTHRDNAGNLVACSDRFDNTRNAVLLSAHIDTVGADPAEWKSSSSPFRAFETSTHIVGRGANDCKAGVAMMLLTSRLQCELPLDNVVLLFSYREEGNRGKTSTTIGEELGRSIPLSNRRNLLLCLENTVGLNNNGAVLSAYDCEPCNAFISVRGDLVRIRSVLCSHPGWKPIAIRPASQTRWTARSRSLAGTSGHAATMQNCDNVIYRSIMDVSNGIIEGGDEGQPSVIANRAQTQEETKPVEHVAVLNYRGLTSIADLRKLLEGVSYEEHFPFDFAAGSDRRVVLERGLAKVLIGQMRDETISVAFTSNPGRSDASAIWNATSERDRVEIITMGPGTRSHLDGSILRKTHGPDEGFHKEAGHRAMRFIFDLMLRYLAAE